MYIYVEQKLIACGGISSVGRAPDCGSGGHEFKPHISPHKTKRENLKFSLFLF